MENTNTEMADIDLEDNNNKDKREEEGTELTCRQSFYAKLRASSSMLRDLEGDKLHVLILFFLYCLQGIPLGLINAVPLILTNKNIPYTEQATFSISGYPFSMKVLWAPLVDSVFWAKFGRRKSWLVPVQYLLGLTMLVSSQYVTTLLGDTPPPDSYNQTETGASSNSTTSGEDDIENDLIIPDVVSLTAVFFVFNFLAATQDVAVDGWALTMLKPSNVGYAATCNSVGQTTGWIMGFVLFTTLESQGIVNLSQFMLFWGIVFIVTTSCIAFFMKEQNKAATEVSPEDGSMAEPELGLVEAYKMLWTIIWSPRMYVMIILLFTSAFGFSAAESIFNLKLVEFGVPNDKIAQLQLPMIPVKIVFTVIISRYTVGPTPMNAWLAAFPFRLLMCLALSLFVYVTPLMQLEDGSFSGSYYVLLTVVYAAHRITLYGMFLGIVAFFARISDPVVGATYMTLLNTFTNLGNMWPTSFSLWFVDQVTVKQCKAPEGLSFSPVEFSQNHTIISPSWDQDHNICHGPLLKEQCKNAGGECITIQEGFYTMSVVWVVIGAVWFVWGFRTIRKFQSLDTKEWRVVDKPVTEESDKKMNLSYSVGVVETDGAPV